MVVAVNIDVVAGLFKSVVEVEVSESRSALLSLSQAEPM
jgi:hypothetical protein